MKFVIHALLVSVLLSGCAEKKDPTLESSPFKIKETAKVNWVHFNASIFDTASDCQKLVLLDLGANWCHWCHVMEDSTYSNPDVIAYLNTHFVAAAEDQDSRADLFALYKEYGWPATIVFTPDGREIAKLSGYRNPRKFLAILKNLVANPVPLEEEEKHEIIEGDLSPALQDEMKDNFTADLDLKLGGYDWYQKLLKEEAVEYALLNYMENQVLADWLDKTIHNSYNLVDPVWGGVYQYSTNRDWDHHHFEKLLRYQARYINAYTSYYAVSGDKSALDIAERIYAYIVRFLNETPPLFNNSQDADVVKGEHAGEYFQLNNSDRLKIGVPKVDLSTYTRENAEMCQALIRLWAATQKDEYKQRSESAISLLINSRKAENGLIRRQPGATSVYSLDDNLAVLDALILSYQAFGNKEQLVAAERLAKTSIELFKNKDNRLVSTMGDLVLAAEPDARTNINMARSLNLLSHLSNNQQLHDEAKSIFKANITTEQITYTSMIPLILITNQEINSEPYHAVWLTAKNVSGDKMIGRALIGRNRFVVIERLDPDSLSGDRAGMFGGLSGCMFFCTESFCSSPLRDTKQLERFLTEQG